MGYGHGPGGVVMYRHGSLTYIFVQNWNLVSRIWMPL